MMLTWADGVKVLDFGMPEPGDVVVMMSSDECVVMGDTVGVNRIYVEWMGRNTLNDRSEWVLRS